MTPYDTAPPTPAMAAQAAEPNDSLSVLTAALRDDDEHHDEHHEEPPCAGTQ